MINKLMEMPRTIKNFYQTYGSIPRTTDILYEPISDKKSKVSPRTKRIVRRFLKHDESSGFFQRIKSFLIKLRKNN